MAATKLSAEKMKGAGCRLWCAEQFPDAWTPLSDGVEICTQLRLTRRKQPLELSFEPLEPCDGV
jgi:hypothetical protein